MNILLVGGGSGGHFFPCMTLIDYLNKYGNNCFYIGGKNKYEDKKKDLIHCKYLLLELSGFNNSLKSLSKLIKSYFKNKKIIKNYIINNKIDKIILFGNYESLIVALVAKKLQIPYYIHEQNSSLGRSNYLIQKDAKKIFTTFKYTNKIFDNNKVVCVGNPRTIKKFHQKKGNKILVILGSLGASDLYKKLYSYFEDLDYDVTFVLGENVKFNKQNSKCKIMNFFDHKKDSFNNYDFIITRAGATTLAEISGFAIPCLIIPSPNVVNNHQEKNAIEFCNKTHVSYLNESQINKNKILNILNSYLNDYPKYLKTQINLYNFAVSNSCERIKNEIYEKER